MHLETWQKGRARDTIIKRDDNNQTYKKGFKTHTKDAEEGNQRVQYKTPPRVEGWY